MTFTIGATASFTHVVQEQDLATNWQNNVEVLATPVLLWLAELACMKAIENSLDEGVMTVGIGHDVKHLAPTPLGFTITLAATLIAAKGHKLLFTVVSDDGHEQILVGQHERAWVLREKFISRVQVKRKNNRRKIDEGTEITHREC